MIIFNCSIVIFTKLFKPNQLNIKTIFMGSVMESPCINSSSKCNKKYQVYN